MKRIGLACLVLALATGTSMAEEKPTEKKYDNYAQKIFEPEKMNAGLHIGYSTVAEGEFKMSALVYTPELSMYGGEPLFLGFQLGFGSLLPNPRRYDTKMLAIAVVGFVMRPFVFGAGIGASDAGAIYVPSLRFRVPKSNDIWLSSQLYYTETDFTAISFGVTVRLSNFVSL